MRRRLFLVTLAVTTVLVAAFAFPLAVLIREVARDRAITEAEQGLAAARGVDAAEHVAAQGGRGHGAQHLGGVAEQDADVERSLGVGLADQRGSLGGRLVEVLGGQPYPVLDDRVTLTKLASLDIFNDTYPGRLPAYWEHHSIADAVETAQFLGGTFSEILSDNVKSSCVLLVDTAEYASMTFRLCDQIKRRGIPLIVITDKYSHWAKEFTPLALEISTRVDLYWDSMSAISSILTLLTHSVAEQLGNTPAVCKASYVDPRVVDRFENGETVADALRDAATAEGDRDAQRALELAVCQMLSA